MQKHTRIQTHKLTHAQIHKQPHKQTHTLSGETAINATVENSRTHEEGRREGKKMMRRKWNMGEQREMRGADVRMEQGERLCKGEMITMIREEGIE